MSALLKLRKLPRAVDAARLDQNILGLAAIGAAVHAQRAADGAGNAAEEREAGEAGLLRLARHHGVEHGAARGDAIASRSVTALKPRPSRITTPGTPPSRTIRLEPAPITVTGISGGKLRRK